MSLLYFLGLLILGALIMVSQIICIFLKFYFWKYQFSGRPTSLFNPFAYQDIILRVPVGLNLNVLVTIQQISCAFWERKVHITGLSINVLINDEFDKWNNEQIELLKMLDDIRTILKRGGMLQG